MHSQQTFADIFNNVLFEGKSILKKEELTSLPTESYVREVDGEIHKEHRDVRKADKDNNVYCLVYGIENHSGVDNTMPERVMGYDYAAYEAQEEPMEDKVHTIKHPDEFLELLSEVANDKQYKEVKEKLREKKEDNVTMCVIADKLVSRGREQGIEQGIEQGMERGRLLGEREGLERGLFLLVRILIKDGKLDMEEGAKYLDISVDTLSMKLCGMD